MTGGEREIDVVEHHEWATNDGEGTSDERCGHEVLQKSAAPNGAMRTGMRTAHRSVNGANRSRPCVTLGPRFPPRTRLPNRKWRVSVPLSATMTGFFGLGGP